MPNPSDLSALLEPLADLEHRLHSRGALDRSVQSLLSAVRVGAMDLSPKARGAATPTVREALLTYLEASRAWLAESTWRRTRANVLHQLIPAFGHHRLGELSRAHLREWAEAKQCTRKRLANLMAPLREVLAVAVDDGVIAEDPAEGWRPRRRREQRVSAIDPFAPQELRAIVDTAQTVDPGLGHLAQVGCWTGLRTSELIALKWSDVEEDHLQVRRSTVDGQVKSPKTPTGMRQVKLLAPAREALQAQRALTGELSDVVFHGPDGGAWRDTGQLRKRGWRPLLEKAGVRYRYPYQVRHTYASTMLSAGEPIAWVAAQMGHTDMRLVATRYGRWIPTVEPDAGDRAERTWN